MKGPSLLALLLPAVASARFIEADEVSRLDLHPEGIPTEPAEQFLVELSPGVTKLVTEEQKWELRRVSQQIARSLYHCLWYVSILTTSHHD